MQMTNVRYIAENTNDFLCLEKNNNRANDFIEAAFLQLVKATTTVLVRGSFKWNYK